MMEGARTQSSMEEANRNSEKFTDCYYHNLHGTTGNCMKLHRELQGHGIIWNYRSYR